LEPVWEAFAEKVEHEQLDISIIRVDCVENRMLCMEQHIQAFPTLRVFKRKDVQPPDYRSDRTVDAMLEFAKEKLALDHEVSQMDKDALQQHNERKELMRDDHPGCLMSGFLLVNRVPGNFHIEARSKHHNLNPALANVSHVVNHLSFGPVLSSNALKRLSKLPEEYFSVSSTQPMNGNAYVTSALHQSWHHYIKTVSTHLGVSSHKDNSMLAYQMVQSSQIMKYSEDEVPEARFAYDLSPMAVTIQKSGKKWYQFVTSICALVGGTFVVMGLLANFLNVVFKSKKS